MGAGELQDRLNLIQDRLNLMKAPGPAWSPPARPGPAIDLPVGPDHPVDALLAKLSPTQRALILMKRKRRR